MQGLVRQLVATIEAMFQLDGLMSETGNMWDVDVKGVVWRARRSSSWIP